MAGSSFEQISSCTFHWFECCWLLCRKAAVSEGRARNFNSRSSLWKPKRNCYHWITFVASRSLGPSSCYDRKCNTRDISSWSSSGKLCAERTSYMLMLSWKNKFSDKVLRVFVGILYFRHNLRTWLMDWQTDIYADIISFSTCLQHNWHFLYFRYPYTKLPHLLPVDKGHRNSV